MTGVDALEYGLEIIPCAGVSKSLRGKRPDPVAFLFRKVKYAIFGGHTAIVLAVPTPEFKIGCVVSKNRDTIRTIPATDGIETAI
jgi:hypothetical protein